MQNSFKLGSLFGIAIFVHLTWFIVFVLVSLALVNHFGALFPQLPVVALYAVGLLASLLFFGSVLFHELAHSLLAVRRGQPVHSITLFIFGGVSSLEKEADKPNTEIWVALVGPLSSFALAAAFGALWLLSRAGAPLLGALAGWLALINLMLGAFNLLPGLPLDGGRVLRGVLWRVTGDPLRATRLAGAAGRLLGYGLILLGLWRAGELGDVGGGIWLGFIGFFLLNAAKLTVLQAELQQALAGVQAAQVMNTDCATVPPGLSLSEFVEHYLLRSGRPCYVAGELESPRGLITLAEVRAVPRAHWPHTSVQAAMRPLDQLPTVTPETALTEVLKLLDAKRLAQVPVLAGGKLAGLIGHEQLLQLLRNRTELAAS